MRTTVALALTILVSGALRAADLPTEAVLPAPHRSVEQNAQKAWKRSLLPLLASQSLDVASSYGMRELNPMLADSTGAFGMRATSVKFGVVGAFIGVEYLLVRKHPGAAKVLSKLNWAAAGVTTGFAAHNFAIR
jgi:hypothetical protein